MSVDLQSACERFDKALSSLLDMNAVLRDDLEVLLAAFPHQSGQVLRRKFIRASWAYVEAITFAFKNMATWESHKSAFVWLVGAFDGLLQDIVANAASRRVAGGST